MSNSRELKLKLEQEGSILTVDSAIIKPGDDLNLDVDPNSNYIIHIELRHRDTIHLIRMTQPTSITGWLKEFYKWLRNK